MKTQAYRHGEIAFIKTGSIPEMDKTNTNVFSTGSEGNNHSFKGGTFYRLEKPNQHVIGYFKADETKLYHPQHSPKRAILPDGLYEVRTTI